MTRIAIDADLCQGTGECAALAPGAVTFDDLGIAHPVDVDLDEPLVDRLIATCPSSAISVAP